MLPREVRMSEPVTFLVRMSGEFVEHFFARTNGGDKVSMELGPADVDGISEARFAVDYTNNLLRAAEQRIAELEEAGRGLYYAGFWRCDREVDEVALWDRMKAVLGLPHGTSPARTVEGGEDE